MPPFKIPSPTPGPFVFGPDSHRQPGVPKGAVTQYHTRSSIFPGTLRDYWVYVPAQYSPDKPANVMVFQDGGRYVDENGPQRVPIVFDNLIHQGKLPVIIGVFVNPGYFPPVTPGKIAADNDYDSGARRTGWVPSIDCMSNRGLEYDTMTDRYARFIVEEILASVGEKYRLTDQASGRAICGCSSGGVCAFIAAWERPDLFSKVISQVGSFTDFAGAYAYPTIVRRTKGNRKPVRVFLQASENDLDIVVGNWALGSINMAAALHFAEYDYRLEYGDGAHDMIQGGAIFPESVTWLWRP